MRRTSPPGSTGRPAASEVSPGWRRQGVKGKTSGCAALDLPGLPAGGEVFFSSTPVKRSVLLPRSRQLLVHAIAVVWFTGQLVDGAGYGLGSALHQVRALRAAASEALPDEPLIPAPQPRAEQARALPCRAVSVKAAPLPTALLLLSPAAALAEQVVSVGDGDTLSVMGGGWRVMVRLACIDAPETRQRPSAVRCPCGCRRATAGATAARSGPLNRENWGSGLDPAASHVPGTGGSSSGVGGSQSASTSPARIQNRYARRSIGSWAMVQELLRQGHT